VVKILGASIYDSAVMSGLIVSRNAEGTIQRVTNPKVAVYNAPLDPQSADTKGTVLIKNADELLNYTKSEEDHAEKIVKSIADAGVNLVVAGGSVSEIMLHFLEKYRLMVVKVNSKFELKRICKALGATPIARLGAPLQDELGQCDLVHVQEIGSQNVTVFDR
jgi:T-complex protein 1 subunit theta